MYMSVMWYCKAEELRRKRRECLDIQVRRSYTHRIRVIEKALKRAKRYELQRKLDKVSM